MTKQARECYITGNSQLDQYLARIADRLDIIEGLRPDLDPGFYKLEAGKIINTDDAVDFTNIILSGNGYARSDTGCWYVGAGDDASFCYDGTDAKIKTNHNAASDLLIECGSQKTIELVNTVYDDLPPFSISSFKPTGAGHDPTLATFIGNIEQFTFDINDFVSGATEITHKYKEGTNISIHVHWATNGSEVGDTYVNWEVEWDIANSSSAFTGTSIPSTGDTIIAGGTTDRTHYTTSVGTITGTNVNIGAYIVFRVRRIALTGAGADPAADPFLLAVGFHVQQDTIGSRQLYIK